MRGASTRPIRNKTTAGKVGIAALGLVLLASFTASQVTASAAGGLRIQKPTISVPAGVVVEPESSIRHASPRAVPQGSPLLCLFAPSAANCDGKDPVAAGCSQDASTTPGAADPTHFFPNGGYEQVYTEERWSNHCQSNWARATLQARTFVSADMLVWAVRGSTGYSQTAFYASDQESVYSNMLYGGPGTPCIYAVSETWPLIYIYYPTTELVRSAYMTGPDDSACH
jgi:hypothetical protein